MSRAIHGFVCLSLILAGISFLASATAQEPGLPKPGPEHARLKALEGTWDAVTTMSDGKKSKGEMSYRMECGGLWLASDFKGELAGEKFHGKGFDGYDPAKKKYVAVWVDTMLTTPLFMEGTYDPATKAMTHIGEGPGPDGKTSKMKCVTKTPDNDHQTFEMYMPGPDGKEMKMMTIEYTRRK
jgi:hypothetical protein